MICSLCPRKCGVDREISHGYCGAGLSAKVARAELHMWEEPCISGKNGSGTVFFSGCNLRCVYCQNYEISRQNNGAGKEISDKKLSEVFLRLQEQHANNINLVTPTPYVPNIINALDMVKDKLHIPTVYNCGGYESVETLKMLDGYIDIYMPDFKYCDSETAKKYSEAPDYPETVTKALEEMHRQTKELEWNGDLLKKGLIVRHLVLPYQRKQSMKILDLLKETVPQKDMLLSLMSQFTPTPECKNYPEIDRRITTFEYNSVCDYARKLDFNGYFQERESAQSVYIPQWNFEI